MILKIQPTEGLEIKLNTFKINIIKIHFKAITLHVLFVYLKPESNGYSCSIFKSTEHVICGTWKTNGEEDHGTSVFWCFFVFLSSNEQEIQTERTYASKCIEKLRIDN